MALTTTGAVYGVTTYHTEYYGASPTSPATFRWGVEVDWDGDGVFDGTNEATRLLQIQCDRGRKNWLQPNGQGFYPISVGTCHITLDNYDGRYDAWNTSSPLYPNVTYGRDVRIRVVDVSDETSYNVFYGVIADIVPSGYGANAVVKITIEDGLRYLRNVYVSGGEDPYAVYIAINEVLMNSLWPSRWGTSIDTAGADLIDYWEIDGTKSALDEILEIADSFYGNFFIAANGEATYKDKVTIPASITDYPADVLLKDIGNPQPWLYYRNLTRVFWSTYGSTALSISSYPVSTASITEPREFILNATWIQNVSQASDASSVLGAFLAMQHKTPIVQLVNRPGYQFPELFDIITVTIPTLGISGDSFKVGGIEHHGTPQEVKTVLYLEPYLSAASYWTWDIADYGTDTIFGF